MMTVMFTDSFYSEYELYRTDDQYYRTLINKISDAYALGIEPVYDKSRVELLGSQDDIDFETAQNMTDWTVYLDDDVEVDW